MGKILCRKILCLDCNTEGLGQIFLRKDNSISYVRIRHYTGLDPTNKKPTFKYCRVSDKATLDNLAISLSQESMLNASKPDLTGLDQKSKTIAQNLGNTVLIPNTNLIQFVSFRSAASSAAARLSQHLARRRDVS